MEVKIKRQASGDSTPYWQTFSYNGPVNVPVSALLDSLNYTDDLFDITGQPAARIRWECSCMQGLCGGCAMVINGRPALACKTFLKDLKRKVLVLEPLSKFPVVADLIVDRSILYDQLKQAQAYLDARPVSNEKEYAQQYSVAKCLKCGLCMEVCPNYQPGSSFYGPVFANESYLLYTQTQERREELAKNYHTHFSSGCSKALSCQSICPVGIETLSSILKMNRVPLPEDPEE